MDATRATAIAKIFYQDSQGYTISRLGKEPYGLANERAFTYGEIAIDAWPQILEMANPKKGAFYDLGSGAGKAVITTALLGGFVKVYGIELIKNLVEESNRILERFTTGIAPLMKTEEFVPDVQFIENDFLTYNWSDADCVFIQGTCMPPDILSQVAKRCEKLKPGSKIIVTSTQLDSPILRLKNTHVFPYGWGDSITYFYERP